LKKKLKNTFSLKFNSQDVLVPLLNAKPVKQSKNAHENLQRSKISSKHLRQYFRTISLIICLIVLSNKCQSEDESCEDEKHPDNNTLNNTLNEVNKKMNQLKYADDSDDVFRSSDTNSISDQSLETLEQLPKPDLNGTLKPRDNSFVDNLKLFISERFSFSKPDEAEKNAATPDTGSRFSIDFFEHYKRMFQPKQVVAPKDFASRHFPCSSETCEKTFASGNAAGSGDGKDGGSDLPEGDGCLEEEGDYNNLNKRYYHVFRRNELDDLIRESCPGLVIYDSYYDHGNWCICALKESS
jgi:hypothetical protein